MKTRIALNAILGIVLFIFCAHFTASGQSTSFTQSATINDAYIELEWNIDYLCLLDALSKPYDEGIYIQILDTDSGKEVYGQSIVNLSPFVFGMTNITGSYQHYVGPGKTIHYQLNVLQIGDGSPVIQGACTNKTLTGTTLAFQAPTLLTASDATRPDSIVISWKNNSKLSSNFRIYRNGQVIAVITGTQTVDTTFQYVDAYRANAANSLVNGASYNYCIETFSKKFNTAYAQVCDAGSTYDIGLTATDNTFADKVNLTWNSVAAFCNQITIRRNGILIATLPNDMTNFSDTNPIYGFNSTYTIELVTNGKITVVDSDMGMVPVNGKIAGKVYTKVDQFPIIGAKVKIEAIVQDSLAFSDSTYTDFTGYYEFNDIYYGVEAVFTITVSKDTREFISNPRQLTLNPSMPKRLDVDFLAKTGYDVGLDTIAVTDFTLTPDSTSDKVVVSWNYTSTADTTYFNLYREATLIATLNDASGAVMSFEDLNGNPEWNYEYRLIAYAISGNNITSVIQKMITAFPAVTPVASLTATADNTLGVVNLSWTHTSTNFTGFRIYRNDVLIADVANNVFSYTDLKGSPGTSATYSITAYRSLSDVDYESIPTTAAPVTYPTLLAPASVSVTPVPSEDLVEISWTVPGSLMPNYNYTGFILYRDDQIIGYLLKAFAPAMSVVKLQDKTGVPGANYNYRVSSYIEHSGTRQEVSSGVVAGAYPPVLPPAGLTATPGQGSIALNWNTHSSTNHAGFIIYRGAAVDSVGNTGVGKYSYTDYINNPPYTSAVPYQVKSYRIVDGVYYYSTAATTSATPTAGANNPQLPSNFVASNDIPDHVKLSWTYPEFLLSTFTIYRDGTPIAANLPTTSRAYYDYGALPGVKHLYAIEAKYQTNTTQQVKAEGMRRSLKTISGKVITALAGLGVPNVGITATASNYYATTSTDSTGYYRLESVPDVSGLMITVQAQAPNSDIAVNPQMVTIGTDYDYTVNFIDNYELPTTNDVIASPTKLTATPDPINMGVVVSWTTNNSNYSGFEVYRATTLIGIVNKGEPLTFTDTKGIPGILYGYRVRAFLDTETDRIFSGYATHGAVYPLLEPVTNLTATPLNNENKLLLQWSHKYDSHKYYLISRNENPIALVNTGGVLAYEDTSGVPGQLYRYTVTAVKLTDTGIFESNPTTVTTTYPSVARVQNLSATIPVDAGVSPTYQLNHVLLDWDYISQFGEGFDVFRNDTLIAQLPFDSTYYRDYAGFPDALSEYKVVAKLTRENRLFTSRYSAATVTYPLLTPPYDVSSAVDNSMGDVKINYRYQVDGADGYYVYKMRMTINMGNIMVIDTVYDATFDAAVLKEYRDKDGVPNLATMYDIQAFSVRDGKEYKSVKVAAGSQTFPMLPAPTNFAATDGTVFNAVNLTWTYNPAVEIDGFEITIPGVGTKIIDKGMRDYVDIANMIGNNAAPVNYSIRAFKVIFGTTYYSVYATDSGIAGIEQQGYNQFTDAAATATVGWAVAMDGNKAVVGAPQSNGGFGNAAWYEKTNNGWVKRNGIGGGGPIMQYGYDVDILGNRSAVGAPASDEYAPNSGTVYFYNGGFNPVLTNAWTYGTTDIRFGSDVAIATSDVNNVNMFVNVESQADVYFFRNNGADPAGAYSNPNNNEEYISLAASDTYVIAGSASDVADLRGFIDIYKRDAGNLAYTATIMGEQKGDNFGISVDVAGNIMVVGADHKDLKGVVYVYQNNNGTWEQVQRINEPPLPNNSDADRFGYSVATNGEFLVIGAKGHYDIGSSSTRTGVAFLYKRSGNTFEFIETISMPDGIGGNGDSFGFSVDVTKEDILIGAPYHAGKGAVFFYSTDLKELWYQKLNNVTATDGTLTNGTRIDWSFAGNKTYIDGFNIYRDTSLIATVDGFKNFYLDPDGIPGQVYTYSVAVKVASGQSLPKADTGYKQGNGVIGGEVKTLRGNSPVQGVVITATGEVAGEYYTYTGTTDVNGKFSIPAVFYGDSSATYRVTPYFPKHIFDPAATDVILTPQQHLQSSLFFLDQTAYIVKGTIAREGITCGLDSIQVNAVSVLKNGTSSVRSVMTNTDGEYSVVIDPTQANLKEIRIQADNYKILQGQAGSNDTIFFKFRPEGQTVFTMADFPNLPIETTLDFTDTLTYPVKLIVQNTCELPISASKFKIRARTLDGCYDKTFETNTAGQVIANLPPLELEMNVTNVNNLTIQNIQALEYLEYRPVKLDLYTIHKDTARYLTALQLDSLTQRKFTYHKPPNISIVSGLNRFFCDDPSKSAIIDQDEKVKLKITVTENHNGQDCPVAEGYIRIINAAATESDPLIIPFVDSINGFPLYEFVGGSPNLVEPFLQGLTIEYFSENNDFLGSVIQPIFVQGTAAVPGTDIIVNPSKNDQVQFPLFILRDPPGDGSSSTISAGETFTGSISVNQAEEGGATFFTNLKFLIFGVGASFNFEATLGGGGSQGKNWEYSVTTTQELSTSDSDLRIGRKADVIAGVGLSMQYGLVQELRAGCDTIYQTTRLGFSPHSVNTTWIYTVEQIEGIIEGYRTDSARVEAGTLQITRGDSVLTRTQALSLLETYKSNWKQVLEYHDLKTLPHYLLCSSPPDTVLPQNIQNAISGWKNQFCTKIGTFDDKGNFKMNDPSTIVWNNELIRLYNAAGTAIRNLRDATPNPGGPLVWQYGTRTSIDDYVDNQYNALFGPLAENITFGGGTSITKTIETAQASSKSFSSSFNFGTTIELSNDFDEDLGLVMAPLGIGVLKRAADFMSTIGGRVNFEYKIEEERTATEAKTVTIGYTLTDNDVGDQFSVAVIQGASQNHTPYFSTFGGRSGCPAEDVTIKRDDISLKLYDPETGATFSEQTKYDVPADDPAVFFVQMTNQNPFNETRHLSIYVDNATNLNGARVQLGSTYIGEDQYVFLPPGQPVTVPLTIQRGLVAYEHPDITICAYPYCYDGAITFDQLKCIKVSAYFQNPCSPVTIVKPGDNWVINRRNPLIASSRETLPIFIADYNATNPILESVKLQYRRLGAGTDWEDIPLSDYKEPNFILTAAALQEYNDTTFLPGQRPTFPFIWDITDNFDRYPDGDYEIRAVALCGPDQRTFSNAVRGRIDRAKVGLFGQPQPADGLLQTGDEISVTFNKNIDCGLINQTFIDSSFFLYRKSDMTRVPATASCLNNKLVFDIGPYANFDGDTLLATLANVRDVSGNRIDTIRWDFAVVTHPLYWGSNTIELQMYQNDTRIINAPIFSTYGGPPVAGNLSSVGGAPWITFPGAINVPNQGLDVPLTLNTTGLAVGTYTETVQVAVAGQMRQPAVTIKLKVFAQPPNWHVNPSDFSDLQPLVVVGNWQYEGDSQTSKDSLDLISAWVDNEIRGVANVVNAGNNMYAAYLTVYGNSPADLNKPVEFRVWDASLGMEYDAHLVSNTIDTIRYQSATVVGTTQNPILLEVDSLYDKARYIPLNGSGWTWFSLNTQETNMTVNRMLRELASDAQDGDIIRTQTTSAAFLPGTGWVSNGGLSTMNVLSGYAIYRNSPDEDSIRVTGKKAVYTNAQLQQGWNFVGYPRQFASPINSVLNLLPANTGAQIFTSRSLLDNNVGELSQFTSPPNLWLGSLTNLKPNRAYQIFVPGPSIWLIPGSTGNAPLTDDTEKSRAQKSGRRDEVNPENPDTWSVNPAAYAQSMIVVAEIAIDGVISADAHDKVAAFIKGECRGLAELTYIEAINKYIATLFVYANQSGEDIEFRLFDATTNEVYRHGEELTFQSNKVLGSILDPYLFENRSKPKAVLSATPVRCDADQTGTARVGEIKGGIPPYQISWSTGATTSTIGQLAAGVYRVEVIDSLGQVFIDSVEVVNQKIPVSKPTVLVNGGQAICKGTDLWITAESNLAGATYRWYNTEGKLLAENEMYGIPNIQNETTLFVETNVGGCVSEKVEIPVPVQSPDAAFTVLPSEVVAVGDTVHLVPNAGVNATYSYYWTLDHDVISQVPETFHVYQSPGLYDISLKVVDSDGCTATVMKDHHIQVQLSTGVEDLTTSTLRLSAHPNPFTRQLKAIIEAEKAGDYQLVVRDLTGRTLWTQVQTLQVGRNEVLLDSRTSGLAVGAYFLEVSNGEREKAVVKIIKQATP